MSVEAGDDVVERLVVRRSSYIRATSRSISGEKVPYYTVSEGSSSVDEKGISEPGRDKLRKDMYRENMARGKMTCCLGKSSSCESQSGAVDEDQGQVPKSSRRLDGYDTG